MPMRIRMAMHGHTHRKIFHIVAINSPLRRDAKPTELLGIYDPHAVEGAGARTVRWSVGRIHHWLDVGAQPSKSVSKLLELGGILKPGSPYFPKDTELKNPMVPIAKTKSKTKSSKPSKSTSKSS